MIEHANHTHLIAPKELAKLAFCAESDSADALQMFDDFLRFRRRVRGQDGERYSLLFVSFDNGGTAYSQLACLAGEP